MFAWLTKPYSTQQGYTQWDFLACAVPLLTLASAILLSPLFAR